MKKLFSALIALMIALTPLLALTQAVDSPTIEVIQHTEVPEVTPEDETKEVVPPTVDIITDTEEVTEIQDDLKTIYHLTIRYIYEDNTTAAQPYEEILQSGLPYAIPSPEIDGYVTFTTEINGIMPSRDLVYTVIYFRTEQEDVPEEQEKVFDVTNLVNVVTFEDYETPLGLGFAMSNVGICFE
jgi:hypothetical protein